MAAAVEYNKEQLNYYRICYVTTDILADGLRAIFKQEWDKLYKTTKGEWKDEARNGTDFWNMETPRNQTRNARLWNTMINGNRSDWDCTMLFYAILYSDCIRHSLNPVVQSNVDDLRKFRNEEFAHMPQGHLTDAEFQTTISKVEVAFQALGLPTIKIQAIRNQASFPTEELSDVLKKVDDLKQENQVLEDQLNKDVSSFCILPPKPSHDVASRDCDVANVTEQLTKLKNANKNKLSCLYISGNPGSGKSQLAGLVAKRFFDVVRAIPSATLFVMTVNAESPKTLLESYVSFGRHLNCPEYAITNTVNCDDLNTEEKIANLKSLIGTKVESYTTWLLVVDNVTSISTMHAHLPDHGSEPWLRGQLLITTQDTQSIPLTSSFLQHISVSKGMDPVDASSLLSMLSGINDSEKEKEEEVAQALDYQPLAIASAATYVKQVRQNRKSSNFGWNDYLKKLEEGRRGATETLLAETNPSYQKSMTTAITLAVEKEVASDKVIDHTFTLLSLCAPQQLSLEIIISYILYIDGAIKDKEAICMKIQRCSLLLFEEGESGVNIRVHQVVHEAINTVQKDLPEKQHIQAVSGAVKSFSQFIKDHLTTDGENLVYLVNKKHVVRHLRPLVIKIEELLNKQGLTQLAQGGILKTCLVEDLKRLGRLCEVDSDFYVAKNYFKGALVLGMEEFGPEHAHVASICNDLGNIHQKMGDLEQANVYYDRALSILLETLGPEHIHVASTYNNLAVLHKTLGELNQAKEYYDRALAILLKKLGPEHIDVAITYNNLANNLLENLGDLKQAKEYYDRALAIRVKKLGPEHVDVASTYNNLAVLHKTLGELKQAKEYYDRALAIRLKKLGPEHVDVASTCNNLANLHISLGDLKQAKEYYDRALAIRLKKLGPEHVDVASAYNNLANLHHGRCDLKHAKEYYDRALAILMKKFGPEHVDVATTYHNLANLHQTLGDLKQAKEYYDRALAIRLKILGPDHVDVASTYINLAVLHQTLSDLKQAKEYYDRALAILLKKVGPEHVDVASIYNNLANLNKKLGDLNLAKEYHDRALSIRLKKLGPEHVDVAITYNNLANLHKNLGDLKQAKEYYDRALAILLKKLDPEHVDVAVTYNNLASLHKNLGDLKQAKEYYDRALAILLEKLSSEHAHVLLVLRNLAELEQLVERDQNSSLSRKRRNLSDQKQFVEKHPREEDYN